MRFYKFRKQFFCALVHIFFVVSSLFLAVGCNPARHLPKNQWLYTESTFGEEASDSLQISSTLREQVLGAMKPSPNVSLLGWRYRLGMYNLLADKENGKPEDKQSFRYWLKYKVGRPPVLLSAVNPRRTAKLIQNKFYNAGFFDAKVSHQIFKNERKRQGGVLYTAHYFAPYRMNMRFFPEDSTNLGKHIKRTESESLLTKGSTYSLETLKKERERISGALKNEGFFYFSPDFLLFQIDSTLGARQFNLYMKLKKETPPKAYKQYLLGEVYILLDVQNLSPGACDTVTTAAGYRYVSHKKNFRPEAVARHIFFRKGERYKHDDYRLTLRKLTSINVFKFINIRFTETEDEKLDVRIYLTPLQKKYVRLQANAISKSNGFAGPKFTATYSNRNTFKGAEKLSFDLNTSYEAEISKQNAGVHAYQLGGKLSLKTFRFLTPFKAIRQLGRYTPETEFSIGYNITNRVKYFRMSSFQSAFGYRWHETSERMHVLNPLTINYVELANISTAFQDILSKNRLLARSLEDQFIIGSNYSFTFNSQTQEERKNYIYFNGNLDIAGNSIYLLQRLIKQQKPSDDSPFLIFFKPYSQYVRLILEGRFYQKFGRHTQLVLRCLGGLGLPLGSSHTLPYVKQFYMGGSNSIRAFPARSVGPGGYFLEDDKRREVFLDQVGDIKMEGNAEIRFDLSKLIKWAFFADIGNVWLTKPDPYRPRGDLELRNFYKEFAMGIGGGLRFDFSYLVLRFDLGIPVRKPQNTPAQRWVFHRFSPLNPKWRKENLVLNIAIGYPF